MGTSTKLLSLALALVMAACGDSNFRSGGVALRKPANQSVQIPGIDPMINGGDKTIGRGDSLNISIDAGGIKNMGEGTTTVLNPVDLVFVVDTSSSMKDQINSVKSGIDSLTSQLRARGIDLWVGFVGFSDSKSSVHAQTTSPFLTNNMSSFKSYMNGIVAGGTHNQGNEDMPEGGLYAIGHAVDQLGNGSGRSNALKAIVYVSDVVAHNGADTSVSEDGMPRDCTVTAPMQKISQLVSKLGSSDKFKLFYSVATTGATQGVYRCNNNGNVNGPTAREQMQSLMSSILPNVSYKGGELLKSNGTSAWPLANSTLVESILPALTKTVSSGPNQGACIAQSAQLFDTTTNPNMPISSWQPSTMQEAYQTFSTSNQIVLSNVFKDSYNLSLGQHLLEIRVQRCCMDQSVLSGGSISQASCNAQSYLQTIRYNVNVR